MNCLAQGGYKECTKTALMGPVFCLMLAQGVIGMSVQFTQIRYIPKFLRQSQSLPSSWRLSASRRIHCILKQSVSLNFTLPTERGLCSLLCCKATKVRCSEGADEGWEQPQPPEPGAVTVFTVYISCMVGSGVRVLINNRPNISYTPTVPTSQLFY